MRRSEAAAGSIALLLALGLAACQPAAHGSTDGRTDARVDDDGGVDGGPPDAWVGDSGPPDAWVCVPRAEDPLPETTCDGWGQLSCQNWAASRAPGWDPGVTCMPYAHICARGDACTGVDESSCTCGTGPACTSGFVCARPIGDTGPRSCVCAWGP